MTNEHCLRCITNIEYFTDITNIPQQIMLVFVGNNLDTIIWIKTLLSWNVDSTSYLVGSSVALVLPSDFLFSMAKAG